MIRAIDRRLNLAQTDIEVHQHVAGRLEEPIEFRVAGQSVDRRRIVLDRRAVELRCSIQAAAIEEMSDSH